MADDTRNIRVKVENSGAAGMAWFTGWLFTIGYLHLIIPKALYALVLWPYFLGAYFAK